MAPSHDAVLRELSVTDSAGVAKNRVRFLTAEPVEANQVRDTILASWQRSRGSNVAADNIHVPYVHDPNLDTPLVRSAGPVLRRLHEQLSGLPISIVLTDPTGLVLARLCGDRDLERHLDSVRLAPGFSYAEEFAGTNGIGSALEGGRPMHVFGHEHYAENLEDLACAGVPIAHPVSAKTVGALDLTCWRHDAGPLLVTLAKATASQIQQALLTDSASHEIELLQEYLRVCHRTSGIVVALNPDLVMMNDFARAALTPADQEGLLRLAAEALAERRHATQIELPTGRAVKLFIRPVGGGDPASAVLHAKVIESDDVGGRGPVCPRVPLPGVVGSSPLWLRACDRIDRLHRSGDWLALSGEPGAGKLAVLRAVHQHSHPGGRFTVLDADQWTDQRWLDAARSALGGQPDLAPTATHTVVVQHVDRLDRVHQQTLTTVLQRASQSPGHEGLWVAITFDDGTANRELTRMLRLFPSTAQIPPLRRHLEDIEQLVPCLLARLGHGGQLTCSPEALHLLMRSHWPGNVEQLFQTLRKVVQTRRTGVITPRDLPPENRSVSRRLLSPLESIERDAIAQSLLDSRGNKAEAAKSLGMSRATIYRKIHQFGIVTPAD